MSHGCTSNTCANARRGYILWRSHGRKSATSFPLSGASHCRIQHQQPACHKAGFFTWKRFHHLRVRGRKGWTFRSSQVRQRLGLHTSTVPLNTSASRWTAGISQHMSRVRSTLDTVSKAVSGTHTDLLSKLARLRPNALKSGERVEASVEFVPKAEENAVTPVPISTSSPSTTTMPTVVVNSSSATPSPATPAAPANATTSTHPHTPAQPNVSTTASAGREKRLRRVVPTVKAGAKKQEDPQPLLSDTENKSTNSKQSEALFHPSTFSVSLDDTYTYLAHHINSYFGSSTKTLDKNGGNSDKYPGSPQDQQTSKSVSVTVKTDTAVPVAPPSSKRSLGQYLSYSAPTVQAFLGNYIAPLVPKFRTGETKAAVVEKKSPDEIVKQAEMTVSNEQRAAEEKAKKLLLQREKIIAKVSVDNRTRALVQALHRATDVRVYINRVEDLSYHLLEFPDTRVVAVKEKVIPCLLRLRQASDPGLRAAVAEALSLVGYHKPVRGRGIRILSIDGGGLRGLVALQTLHKLETLTGKPIYKLFDYICGVSTGAILGFMLGIFQIPLDECDDLYRKLGSDVFKQNVIVGTVKMGWKHAFYDSEAWEKILKDKMGSHLMVETSRNPECPKMAAVSTIVNRGTPLKPYVFRNYNLLPGLHPHYLGGCHHQLWQAIRASSAAPGYFQEFALGNDLHQDGGLLINNPTALAIHECKCLWPGTPLECVVSLGTGRYETFGNNSATYTSLKTKLTNVISSATDTEEVHAMLDAFLPPNTYFRFNPFMTEDISMDESRQEKLNLLQAEGVRYLERNEQKLSKVASILTREKSPMQSAAEWARLRGDMYNGLSLRSSRF